MRRSASSLLVALILAGELVSTAAAQDSGTEITASAEYAYGGDVTFHAVADLEQPTLRAALFIQRQGGEPSVYIAQAHSEHPQHFSLSIPATELQLLPFSKLRYWWQIDLADGRSLQSVPSVLTYADDRFAWEEATQDGIIAHWTEGDLNRGQAILTIAEESRSRLQEISLPTPQSLDLYVYPSQSELEAGLRLGGIPLAEAHTIPEIGVVLVSAAPGAEGFQDLERQIPHELTHLMLYERMGADYGNLPIWLSEGLATLQEGSPSATLRLTLEQALASNATLPMASLCGSLPMDHEERLLAYAQSASFMQYLLDVYGTGGLVLLLATYQEGASCEGAVQRIYQRPLSQLEAEWLGTLGSQSGSAAWGDVRVWIGLLLPAFLIALVLLWRTRQARETDGGKAEA